MAVRTGLGMVLATGVARLLPAALDADSLAGGKPPSKLRY